MSRDCWGKISCRTWAKFCLILWIVGSSFWLGKSELERLSVEEKLLVDNVVELCQVSLLFFRSLSDRYFINWVRIDSLSSFDVDGLNNFCCKSGSSFSVILRRLRRYCEKVKKILVVFYCLLPRGFSHMFLQQSNIILLPNSPCFFWKLGRLTSYMNISLLKRSVL